MSTCYQCNTLVKEVKTEVDDKDFVGNDNTSKTSSLARPESKIAHFIYHFN